MVAVAVGQPKLVLMVDQEAVVAQAEILLVALALPVKVITAGLVSRVVFMAQEAEAEHQQQGLMGQQQLVVMVALHQLLLLRVLLCITLAAVAVAYRLVGHLLGWVEEHQPLLKKVVVVMVEELRRELEVMELQTPAAVLAVLVTLLAMVAQAALVLSSSRSTNKDLWKPKSTDFSA
jgi:hypothetical protein